MKPALLLPLACLALAACSKSPEPAAETTPAPAAAPLSVGEVPAAAIAKAEAVVAEVESKSAAAVAELEGTIATAKADATKLYTDAVAKAKAYLGEQKFDQALASLDTLKDVVLTAEQQKFVSDLRAQITKAQDLYKQAQGATKNLFGK
jgi:cell division septum initiation protein DivIVA